MPKAIRAVIAALLAAPLVCAGPVFALKVSSSVGPFLSKAQKEMEGGDLAAAKADVDAARALPAKTADDDRIINQFTLMIALKSNDTATAETAARAIADAPGDPASRKNDLDTAIKLATTAKHYDAALRYAMAGQAEQALTADNAALGAVAAYQLADYADAKTLAQASMALAQAAGTPPPQNAQIVLANVASIAPKGGVAASSVPDAKPVAGAADSSAEAVFWKSLNRDSAADYRAYLKKYPHGDFTVLAKARLAALGAGP